MVNDSANRAVGEHVASDSVRHWMLRRNCALSPQQLVTVYLTLVAISSCIGIGFALIGAWLILPFAGLEMLALGAAFLIYARHATDHERVTLDGVELVVESVSAGCSTVERFNPHWVQVVTDSGYRAAVFLMSNGRRVAIARHVGQQERRVFVQELKRALASA